MIPFPDEQRQKMFTLVRSFGFEPGEVIEGSLSFDGANVQFETMPGRIPRSFNAKWMNETQRSALNALIYPRVIQEDQ